MLRLDTDRRWRTPCVPERGNLITPRCIVSMRRMAHALFAKSLRELKLKVIIVELRHFCA
jgi:hypothetical protein